MKIRIAIQTGTAAVPDTKPDSVTFVMPDGSEIRAGWADSDWKPVDGNGPGGRENWASVDKGFSACLKDVTFDGKPAAGRYRDILGAQRVRFGGQGAHSGRTAEICVIDDAYDVVMHAMPME